MSDLLSFTSSSYVISGLLLSNKKNGLINAAGRIIT